MNILKILTKKDLKQNKKRTIGTLIGILLATALITVVGGMFFVLQNTLLQGTINESGYYHIMLTDVSSSDIENIKLNKNISNIEIVNNIGEDEKCFDDTCLNIYLHSISKSSFDYLKHKVLEGSFPTNSNQVLISNFYANNTDTKIGDSINILGKDYNIVGINSTDDFITVDSSSDDYILYLTLKHPKNYKKDISELLGVNDYTKSDNNKYGYTINTELLRWEVFAFGDRISSMLVSLVAIIIAIILATSVFSIRNSFAISTNEKLKTYGMLSSIGATKKQIRKMVLFEGLCLGVIGISLGLLLGGFVTWFLTWIINYLTKSANMLADGWMLYYKFVWYPYVIAILVGVVMIYLSTLSSSIKASRVSPIQNIRNSDNIKNPKKLRVPFLVRKIFKVGGILSYKNLKRSRRKYRVTVISLTVSILVFIVAASFLEYGLKEVRNEFTSLNYDVVVNSTSDDDSFKEEELKKLSGLAKSHLKYRIDYDSAANHYFYNLYDTSHITNTQAIGKTCFEHDDSYECTGKEIDYVYMMSYYYDDNSFKEICKKLHIDYNKNKDKVIVIDDAIINRKKVRLTDYKKDDTITLKDYEHNSTISYKIAEVSDIRTWGMETEYDPIIKIIANEKYYIGNDKLAADTIYYETKNANKLVDDIEKVSSDLNVSNVAELAKQLKTMILIFSIFIYGFIIVVTLIGVTSVFNTINSNMELRRREFATLKSIGMTKREFNNMILLEAVFYSFKSLFFGIILGIGGSYLVYNAFTHQMDFGYLLPTKAIIISIIFIILLVYTIMKYSISRINKENIIETIRKENV